MSDERLTLADAIRQRHERAAHSWAEPKVSYPFVDESPDAIPTMNWSAAVADAPTHMAVL